jgi:hypothetical protein
VRSAQWLGLAALIAGLLLFVRVMFFGVQRRIDDERMHHRRWPLALAAFLMVSGVALYARADDLSTAWVATAFLLGLGAGAGAWWWVRRSASVPSTDPEDDPRYRFQGHVARVTAPIGAPGDGRIAFEFDGRRHDLRARWSPSAPGEVAPGAGLEGSEVVIEIVEGDVAFVEPWAAVEERL